MQSVLIVGRGLRFRLCGWMGGVRDVLRLLRRWWVSKRFFNIPLSFPIVLPFDFHVVQEVQHVHDSHDNDVKSVLNTDIQVLYVA